jgi:hypothetical protein
MTITRKHRPKRGAERGRSESQTLRVAIAQFAPVYLDKTASLALALQIVQDAKKRGAELLAFGETWFARLSRLGRRMSERCSVGASPHKASVRPVEAEQRYDSRSRNRGFV